MFPTSLHPAKHGRQICILLFFPRLIWLNLFQLGDLLVCAVKST